MIIDYQLGLNSLVTHVTGATLKILNEIGWWKSYRIRGTAKSYKVVNLM